jgi:hypothetical protein
MENKKEILQALFVIAENFGFTITEGYKNLMVSQLEAVASKDNLQKAINALLTEKQRYKMPSLAEWRDAMGIETQKPLTIEEEAKAQWELHFDLKHNEKAVQILASLGMREGGFWWEYESYDIPSNKIQWIRKDFVDRYTSCDLADRYVRAAEGKVINMHEAMSGLLLEGKRRAV